MLEYIRMMISDSYGGGTPKVRSFPLFLPPRRGGHLLPRPLQVDAGLVDIRASGTM
jgi:hypothetical protein